MKPIGAVLARVAAFVLITSATASAETTYSYRGNPFTSAVGACSDAVEIDVTVSEPLAANRPYTEIQSKLVAVTFSACGASCSYPPFDGCLGILDYSITVGTGPDGLPNRWFAQMESFDDDYLGTVVMSRWLDSETPNPGDEAWRIGELGAGENHVAPAGSWHVSSPQPVPAMGAPAMFVLVAALVAARGFVRRSTTHTG